MAAERKYTAQVAPEADVLEQALRAAGLDPDSAVSYPVWNTFVNRGLRRALAAIERNHTMAESFRGVEPSALERARERFNRALNPTQREQIAAAENLVRQARGKPSATTTRPAPQRTTAEILAAHEKNTREINALLERTAPRLAGEQIEQLAAERAKADGIDQVQAYSLVLADRPELYDRYSAELAAGKYAPKPAQPAPAPKLTPAQATIERLAAERAQRDGVSVPEAYAKVLAEQPELYTAYVNEVTL